MANYVDACQKIEGLETQSFAKLVTSFQKESIMKWVLILWSQLS